MKRVLTISTVALFMGLTPVIAADTSTNNDMIDSATGSDTSTGAQVQSSAPPSSDAAESSAETNSTEGVTGSDNSTGAKIQSSAPQDSSAGSDKPNPTVGSDMGADSDKNMN